MAQPRTFEGTWEELQSKATRFKGKRVRVTLLPATPEKSKTAKQKIRIPKCVDKKTEEFLKRVAGSWHGDDLDECMEQVIRTRSETKW